MSDVIRHMFSIIDAGAWDRLDEVFCQDCRYERPGFEPIVGLDALRRFYAHERPIAEGRHLIDACIVEDDRICAAGSFSGRLRNGDPIQLRFSDIYRIVDRRVGTRSTFFFTPLA